MPDRHRWPRSVAAAQSNQLMLPTLEELGSSFRSSRPSGNSGRSCAPGRAAELLAIVSREAHVIRAITACLEELTETQAAKRELCAMSAAEIREAIESRHTLGLGLGVGLADGLPDVLAAGGSDDLPVGLPVALAVVRGASA